MYLYIGNNKNINEKRIIGIFDMESATMSEVTKNFLKVAQKNDKIENISRDLPKCFVVTDDVTYLSTSTVRSFKKIRNEE